MGGQKINYNNTIIANSERRNLDGRTIRPWQIFTAGATVRLFAASAVVPLAEGISHHQEGNNIYGAYCGIDPIIPNSVLEPFILWRVQPGVAIETAARIKTGKQDEWPQVYASKLHY